MKLGPAFLERISDDRGGRGCRNLDLLLHGPFTTLGYGDVVLSDRWRLLSSLEAANGIIMFGWTTAVVMAVVQRSFAEVLQHIHGKNGPGGLMNTGDRNPE